MKYGKDMKKTMTRIAACSLAVLIAFGSVCYKPPKARAFGVESAFATAATFSYLEAIGMSFEGSVYDGMRDSLVDIFVDLSDTFVAGLGILRSDFEAIVGEGVDFLENGRVRISSAAANMLGQFSDWLIDKFGLIGEDGEPVATPVQVGAYVIHLADGNIVPYVPYSLIDCVDNSDYDMTAYYLQTPYKDLLFTSGYKLSMADGLIFCYDPSGVQIGSGYVIPSSPKCLFICETSDGKIGVSAVLSSGQWWNTTGFSDFDTVVGSTSYSISWGTVQLDPDYEAAPTVDEQYAMVIDTGMTFEDEQAFIDSVLAGVASGSFAPTYTIEIATGGDVVVPDEDTDTQAGILGWLKGIAQDVKALPRTIADAIANVFVPSAEYLATVPETIVETFDNRTGFLTYPTSVLYDFADRLHDGQQDFILSWPTIREPTSKAVMLQAGQFNVSKFVRDKCLQ